MQVLGNKRNQEKFQKKKEKRKSITGVNQEGLYYIVLRKTNRQTFFFFLFFLWLASAFTTHTYTHTQTNGALFKSNPSGIYSYIKAKATRLEKRNGINNEKNFQSIVFFFYGNRMPSPRVKSNSKFAKKTRREQCSVGKTDYGTNMRMIKRR